MKIAGLGQTVEGESEDSDCREFISRAKQYSGFHYQATFGRRLWQRYGFEPTLRSEEAVVSVARYIPENPVRAGLVERIDQYEFSGSSVYTIEQILEAVQLNCRWSQKSGVESGADHEVRLKPDATSYY